MRKFLISVVGASLLSGFVYASDVVATVNGKNITKDDIAMLLRNMPNVDFATLPKDIQEKVINQAVERELLVEKAKKEGVEKSKEYKDALESIKDNIALEIYMKQQFDKVTVTPKEVEDFYKANGDKFKQPEQVKARHILLKAEDEAKAKSILEELKKAKPEELEAKFIESAKANSTCPSATNGGDLGYFAKEQMVKEFSDASFGMKKGDMSKELVKSKFGYHIIYVEDKKSASNMALDKVKPQIEENLKLEKFRKSMEEMAESLKKGAKVEIK